jgi:hypothetical protein
VSLVKEIWARFKDPVGLVGFEFYSKCSKKALENVVEGKKAN